MRLRSFLYFLAVVLLPMFAANAATGSDTKYDVAAHTLPASQSLTTTGHELSKDVEHAVSQYFSPQNSSVQNQHSRTRDIQPQLSFGSGHFVNTQHLTVLKRTYSGRIYATRLHHLRKYPEHSFW